MNIKKIVLWGLAITMSIANALDYVEVTDVKARQRYPWNGLVDIDFELDSKATEPYQMLVDVFDNVGKTNLNAATIWTERVSEKSNPCMVATGTRRIVWDAAADLPDGFKCSNVLVSCKDTRAEGEPKRYMVLDISSGANSSEYPVSYLSSPPSGGWTEEYKRSKIVFRRIDSGVFLMGTSEGESGRKSNETQHKVTISSPYYMAVFPVTAGQYYRVTGIGTDSLGAAKAVWGNIRGWDVSSASTCVLSGSNRGNDGQQITYTVTQSSTLSDYGWPDKTGVDPASFIGRLRSRSGKKVDLPTDAQWEYACRAGTITTLNIGGENSESNRSLISNNSGVVGTAVPNALGLYDMCSGEGEWCLDVYTADLGVSGIVDPLGSSLTGNTIKSTMASKVKVMTVPGTTSREYTACIYDGKTYKQSGCQYHDLPVYFTFHAYGVCRIVRGISNRSAERSYGYNINPNVKVFTSGASFKCVDGSITRLSSSYKVTAPSNPSYAIRLCLSVE